jgi:hypothetical protein
MTQWYEMWSKGGCQRRCDSVTEQLTGKPCLCPRAADPENADLVRAASIERDRLAHLNPPQGCHRVTRLNVLVPELPDIGVWRADTSSFWAAGEMADKADALLLAREADVYLPAALRIEPRSRVARGQTTKFNVLVLELLNTPQQIAGGQLPTGMQAAIECLVAAPQLALTAGSAPSRAALPAGHGDAASQADSAERRRQYTRPLPEGEGELVTRGDQPAAPGSAERQQPGTAAAALDTLVPGWDDPRPQDGSSEMSPAQEIAAAVAAGASRVQLSARRKQAETLGCLDDIVNTSRPGEPEVHETLGALLDALEQARAAG